MIISATVINDCGKHSASVQTSGKEQQLAISAKAEGQGSAVNGGELLFLALATCYCNDVYREAKERGIDVTSVQVEVTGHFGGKGEPAKEIQYSAAVKANATQEEVLDLMRHTDTVAEIHNTLRLGASVTLSECTVL
ncbi:OsmC family protein [Terriglobus sp. ADX1]|uniref:OsmC family protein n=1 Tax=Terriglobus sp. ADX1 TaxID=2794063 RepID=UPI002FE5FE11